MSFIVKTTNYLLHSRTRSIIAALSFSLLFILTPILGLIGTIFAAMVTLRKGLQNGLIVFIASQVLFIPIFIVLRNNLIVRDMLIIYIATNIMTWILAAILRSYADWQKVLGTVSVFAIGLVIMLRLLNPHIGLWWLQHLKEVAASSVGNLLSQQDLVRMNDAIANVASQATGLVLMGISSSAILYLIIARWWQAKAFNPGGLRPELYNIRFSWPFALVFALCLGGAHLKNNIALDILPVLLLCFVIAGLSLIHAITSVSKHSKIPLGIFYVILLLLYANSMVVILDYSLLAIAIVALVDAIFDLRKRLKISNKALEH